LNILVDPIVFSYLLGADFWLTFFLEAVGLLEGIYWAIYFGLRVLNKPEQ